MCKDKLETKMKLYGDTSENLACALGISSENLEEKINCLEGNDFILLEINLIKERYNLTGNEVDEIFFSQKVS